MDDFTAIMIAECVVEPVNEEQYIEAWQYLIDTGLAWKLQGRVGRIARSMIESGRCHK